MRLATAEMMRILAVKLYLVLLTGKTVLPLFYLVTALALSF
jgi:hypothetical protein